MATLLFTALGTLIGGPIGGAIGALVGRSVDAQVFGGGTREGPRLKELAITTSSYGTPVPRQFGRMRVAGTIIWATDLVEHRDKHGNGKGQPKTIEYSYTASLAVALSSRPIIGIGRVWADGKLLRGSGGDMKVAGIFRCHTGEHNQPADPLLASAEGAAQCPAHRGLAYAVFEDLELGEFGNRIPALTFEVIADEGTLSLATLLDGVIENSETTLLLSGLEGFSCEGALSATLSMLDPLYPMDCNASGNSLAISADLLQSALLVLPEAATTSEEGSFGGNAGFSRKRAPETEAPLAVLRYYDTARDYQPGAQRAPGRPIAGQPRTIELPAAMEASEARRVVEHAARRAGWARQTLSWRVTQLDPAIAPGSIVAVPDHPGRWRVRDWEWRAEGVELTLFRLAPIGAQPGLPVDPGRSNPAPDLPSAPTALTAFELPWDGTGSGTSPAIYAAASSPLSNWAGAALYVDQGDGTLQPLGPSGRGRNVLGTAVDALGINAPFLFDRTRTVTIELLGEDMVLADANQRQLAQGANRALLGSEIIQFSRAIPLGARRWRLEGLWRGRGGTESAIAGHNAGEPFVLLDGNAVALDPVAVGAVPGSLIAAIGLADPAAVTSPILLRGITIRPLAPVHGCLVIAAGGDVRLGWTRRARGAWNWPDSVETPLGEQSENYEVIFGPAASPIARWEPNASQLVIGAIEYASLRAAAPGASFAVRQRGDRGISEPLIIPVF